MLILLVIHHRMAPRLGQCTLDLIHDMISSGGLTTAHVKSTTPAIGNASRRLPLPRVHVPTSSDPDPTPLPASLASQDAREVVLVHEIPLFAESPILIRHGPNVLLLVLGQDELVPPSTLAAASFPFAAGITGHGLRDAVAVAPVVPLHVLLQMHFELAISLRRARYAGEGVVSAARTELLVHVFGSEEAGVAAFDEGFEVSYPLQCGG